MYKKITNIFFSIKQHLIEYYASTLNKVRNIEQTNIDLVLFHISNNNINDVLLRLNIMKLLKIHSPEINYYFAICYIKKLNYHKALYYLDTYLSFRNGDKAFLIEAEEYSTKLRNGDSIVEIRDNLVIKK